MWLGMSVEFAASVGLAGALGDNSHVGFLFPIQTKFSASMQGPLSIGRGHSQQTVVDGKKT